MSLFKYNFVSSPLMESKFLISMTIAIIAFVGILLVVSTISNNSIFVNAQQQQQQPQQQPIFAILIWVLHVPS